MLSYIWFVARTKQDYTSHSSSACLHNSTYKNVWYRYLIMSAILLLKGILAKCQKILRICCKSATPVVFQVLNLLNTKLFATKRNEYLAIHDAHNKMKMLIHKE